MWILVFVVALATPQHPGPEDLEYRRVSLSFSTAAECWRVQHEMADAEGTAHDLDRVPAAWRSQTVALLGGYCEQEKTYPSS